MSINNLQVDHPRDVEMGQCLDLFRRPQDVQDSISEVFKKLKNQESQWLYNGSKSYRIAEIEESEVIKKIILRAPPERKDFYFLDIGAGNFQNGDHLASFINMQKDLPDDITIHIIGVRGESYFGDKIVEEKKCKIYKLGGFKVEELIAKLEKQGLFLRNSVDLVISNWCFLHLVDPVGTFTQAYDLVRPQTGLMMMDGFFFLRNHETIPKNTNFRAFNKNMTELLVDTKAMVIVEYFERAHSLNRFILQRSDDAPCQLPMSYIGAEPGIVSHTGAEKIIRFKREKQKVEDIRLPNKHAHYYGSCKLYLRLKKEGFLPQFPYEKGWKPISQTDTLEYAQLFPIHEAVCHGDLQKVIEALDAGLDVNSQDVTGRSLLLLAVKWDQSEIVNLLISREADVNIADFRGNTPLHKAAKLKRGVAYIELLIERGAFVDVQGSYDQTPLQMANMKQNMEISAALIKHGADPC